MHLRSVRTQFLERVAAAGHAPAALTPAAGLDLMVGFYRDARIDHCPPDEDGDLLVFQWGVYDWGRGEHFEVNLTRELMTAAGDGVEHVRQLALTFRFPADRELEALGDGEEWCDDPADAERFLAAVRKAKSFRTVAGRTPVAVELTFEEA